MGRGRMAVLNAVFFELKLRKKLSICCSFWVIFRYQGGNTSLESPQLARPLAAWIARNLKPGKGQSVQSVLFGRCLLNADRSNPKAGSFLQEKPGAQKWTSLHQVPATPPIEKDR
jgi:hypothetical protein